MTRGDYQSCLWFYDRRFHVLTWGCPLLTRCIHYPTSWDSQIRTHWPAKTFTRQEIPAAVHRPFIFMFTIVLFNILEMLLCPPMVCCLRSILNVLYWINALFNWGFKLSKVLFYQAIFLFRFPEFHSYFEITAWFWIVRRPVLVDLWSYNY